MNGPTPAAVAVASPCINVCKMEGGLCLGCFRTIEEIAGWAAAADEGKRLMLAAAAQRRERRADGSDPSCDCPDR